MAEAVQVLRGEEGERQMWRKQKGRCCWEDCGYSVRDGFREQREGQQVR